MEVRFNKKKKKKDQINGENTDKSRNYVGFCWSHLHLLELFLEQSHIAVYSGSAIFFLKLPIIQKQSSLFWLIRISIIKKFY